MILLCRAYCDGESDAPEFMLVELTCEFLDSLRARQRLAAALGTYGSGAFQFDSISFCEFSPIWLRRFEAEGELLESIVDGDRPHIRSGPFIIPGTEHGRDVLFRTETDRMQVWPDRFRLNCSLKYTDLACRSETICFEEFFEDIRRHEGKEGRSHGHPG